MFEINYMSSKKRAVSNIEDEIGKLGTQSRIYDCTTGLFTRILTNDHKSFNFTETGIGFNGILQDAYLFTDVLDCDEDEKFILPYDIIERIDSLSKLSIDDINSIIQNGFLQFLSQRDLELRSRPEFGTLLRSEQILMQFEEEGKIGYDEVLQGITDSLKREDLSDEDRKIMEQLRVVYENDMFRQQRVNDEVLQEEQSKRSTQHTAQEISEDLQEIGRSEIEEQALAEIIDGKEIRQVNDREEK